MKKFLALACITLAFVHNTYAQKALVSVFADYGVGAGGTYLWAYPSTVRIKGRQVRVYPVAVHTSLVSKYKYDIFRLKYKKRTIHVHVVDECASGDCKKNNRQARRSNAVLIDLHQSAMNALRMYKWSLYSMRFKKIGTLKRSKIPKRVLSPDGRKGYVPRRWK